jgi:hypothetical protein
MLEIRKARQEWKPIDRKHHAPILEGLSESVKVIDENTNQTVALQILLDDDLLDDRRWLARQLHYGTKWTDPHNIKSVTGASRLNGMRYENRTFGTSAPSPLRQRYGCSYAQFNNDYPQAYGILEKLTKLWWEVLEREWPEKAQQHKELVDESIHADWLIAGVGWTSGIINNTAALPYHRDSANIKGTISAMLCLRNRIGGGALHLPEYDVNLGIPDGSLTIFDGQDLWHGVTPLVNERPDGYRFTIVWYTKAGIGACGCAAEEPQRAAQRVTELAEKKLKNRTT